MLLISGYAAVAVSAACGVVALSITRSNNVDKSKKVPVAIPCVGTGFLALVILWHALSLKSTANDFMLNAAQEYMKNLMKNKPEFKDFAQVIDNPYATKYLTTVISNSLRESEQKQIVKIIDQTERYFEPLQLEQAYKQIEQIINEHVHLHPEFLPSIYREMAYANHTYIWRAQNWKQK